MGYCHFVNVKRIQDLATVGFFVIYCPLYFVDDRYKINLLRLKDYSGSIPLLSKEALRYLTWELFCYLQPVRITYKFNSPEFPDSSHIRLFRTTHSEDRLGGLFSYMPTTESITTPHVHTRAVSRRSID